MALTIGVGALLDFLCRLFSEFVKILINFVHYPQV